jgi:hypothetical protein
VPETASTIPAALDALVAAARRALPGVQVADGQPAEDIADDLMAIGYASDPEEPVVESTLTQEQATRDPDHESYEVSCEAWSWQGHEVDATPVRDRVFAMFSALAAELADDPTLGGVVGQARLSTQAFAQGQSSMGAVAGCRFTVAVDAWTT